MADYPTPNNPFWQQFRDPLQAYWNLPAALRRFRCNPSLHFPHGNDYKIAAWEMAHGHRPIPSFLQ